MIHLREYIVNTLISLYIVQSLARGGEVSLKVWVCLWGGGVKRALFKGPSTKGHLKAKMYNV